MALKRLNLGSTVDGQFNDLFEMLALGLTLEGDHAIQDRLRPDERERFCVQLEGRETWIEIGGRRAAKSHRMRPEHLAEAILPAADARDPRLTEELNAAAGRTVAYKRSAEMLGSAISLTVMPGRQAIDAILRWAPTLETAAYSAGASIMTLLDHDRPMLFADAPKGERTARSIRRRYWAKVNLMGRLTLLSTPAAARNWLGEMANSFDWIAWTPSWPLLRERSLWLAAIGGRAAASFGSAVVDPYFETMRRDRRPMKTLDALFGLTAVALGAPSERKAILIEMKNSLPSLRASELLGLPMIELAAAQALDAMRDPETALQRSIAALGLLGVRQGLFAPNIVRSDGAKPEALIGHLAFAVLPYALSASPTDFFPAATSSKPGLHLGLSDAGIGALAHAAWNMNLPRVGSRLH